MPNVHRGTWVLDILTPLVKPSYVPKPHLQDIIRKSNSVTVITKEPYICVTVEFETAEIIVTGIGFAKCNTKLDEFDSFIGITIALSRAAKDVHTQLKEAECSG